MWTRNKLALSHTCKLTSSHLYTIENLEPRTWVKVLPDREQHQAPGRSRKTSLGSLPLLKNWKNPEPVGGLEAMTLVTWSGFSELDWLTPNLSLSLWTSQGSWAVCLGWLPLSNMLWSRWRTRKNLAWPLWWKKMLVWSQSVCPYTGIGMAPQIWDSKNPNNHELIAEWSLLDGVLFRKHLLPHWSPGLSGPIWLACCSSL